MVHDSDNPFAMRSTRQRVGWLMSLRGFALLATALGLLTLVQSRTREWLLHCWADGITDLSPEQQVERLHQIAALGDLGTQTLINRLLADDPKVAQVAFELLQRQHDDWASRDDDSMARMHAQMLTGLGKIIDALPPSRADWVTQILNDSLVEFAEQQSEPSRAVYAQTNALIARLEGKDRGNASLSRQSETLEARVPSLVPLPVRLLADSSDSDSLKDGRTACSDEAPTNQNQTAIVGLEPNRQAAVLAAQLATNHKSSKDTLSTLSLRDRQRAPLPLQSWNTRSVIALLSSKHTAERDQATEELTQRGLSEEEIRIASQLAATQTEVRLGLLDSIILRKDIDPRPWLLWLAEDPDRELRSRAIDVLSRVDDEAIRTSLRKRLMTEADPAISEQIRQIIDRNRLADSSNR